jgi:hypothetical protein
MALLHLLVDDTIVEDFVSNLDKEKIRVVEVDFESNKTLLAQSYNKYIEDKDTQLIPYSQSMKDIGIWLKDMEI